MPTQDDKASGASHMIFLGFADHTRKLMAVDVLSVQRRSLIPTCTENRHSADLNFPIGNGLCCLRGGDDVLAESDSARQGAVTVGVAETHRTEGTDRFAATCCSAWRSAVVVASESHTRSAGAQQTACQWRASVSWSP